MAMKSSYTTRWDTILTSGMEAPFYPIFRVNKINYLHRLATSRLFESDTRTPSSDI